MAQGASENKEKIMLKYFIKLDRQFVAVIFLATFTVRVSSAVECYWCSGVGLDRRCERSPQNITTGPTSIKCATQYCITTKVINAVTGDVESFARNCDNIPHGNTCIRDTHLITCFQTCTSDLCNSGNPDPAMLGTSTQGSSYTAKKTKEVQGVSSISMKAKLTEATNGVNNDGVKGKDARKMSIVPYKSKLGRYVIQGNTVRYLGNYGHQWWVSKSTTTKRSHVNDNAQEGRAVVGVSAAASKERQYNLEPKQQSPKQSSVSASSAHGISRERTTTDSSRHTFDFISYLPYNKSKSTTSPKKWFSKTSAATPTSAVITISPTNKGKKMWYDEIIPIPEKQIHTSEAPTNTKLSDDKDNGKLLFTHNLLTKPMRNTPLTQSSLSKSPQTSSRIALNLAGNGQTSRGKDESTLKLVTKSKFDSSTLTTEEAELLPILEALITNGFITLEDDTKPTRLSVSYPTTPKTTPAQPTYGLLEAGNIYTPHVHGRKITGRPIHMTVNRRYRKKLASGQMSIRDQSLISPLSSSAHNIVPEPYLVSFFNKNGKDKKSAQQNEMVTTLTPEKPTETFIEPIANNTDKSKAVGANDDFKTSSNVNVAAMNIQAAEKIIVDKNVNSFWQTLSTKNFKGKKGLATGIPGNQQEVTPVPTETNSLTLAETESQITSPSEGLAVSAETSDVNSIDSQLAASSKVKLTPYRSMASVDEVVNENVEITKKDVEKSSKIDQKPSRHVDVTERNYYELDKVNSLTSTDADNRVEVNDNADDSVTILTQSKKTRQRSKLYSEALTNADYVNEVNRKLSERSELAFESSKRENNVTALEQPSTTLKTITENVSTTPSVTTTEKVTTTSKVTTTQPVTTTQSTTTPRSSTVPTTLSTLPSEPDITVKVIPIVPENISAEVAIKKPTDIYEEKMKSPTQSSLYVMSISSELTTGSSYLESMGHSKVHFSEVEKDENLFRTTGINSDFTFRASAWDNRASPLPNLVQQDKKEQDTIYISAYKANGTEVKIQETLIISSDDKTTSYDIASPTIVNFLQGTQSPSSENATKIDIIEKLGNTSLNLQPIKVNVTKAPETSLLGTEDSSVLNAYDDTMKEILKNGKGAKSLEEVPAKIVKPAVHVPGRIEKLEGKRKLFSSRRSNNSDSVHNISIWHCTLLALVTLLQSRLF